MARILIFHEINNKKKFSPDETEKIKIESACNAYIAKYFGMPLSEVYLKSRRHVPPYAQAHPSVIVKLYANKVTHLQLVICKSLDLVPKTLSCDFHVFRG